MARDGWAKRQIENTLDSISQWPDWMIRNAHTHRDPTAEKRLQKKVARAMETMYHDRGLQWEELAAVAIEAVRE